MRIALPRPFDSEFGEEDRPDVSLVESTIKAPTKMKLQEEIEKLQSENRKTNKMMHKMFDLRKPSEININRTEGGLNILINATGIEVLTSNLFKF